MVPLRLFCTLINHFRTRYLELGSQRENLPILDIIPYYLSNPRHLAIIMFLSHPLSIYLPNGVRLICLYSIVLVDHIRQLHFDRLDAFW